MDTLANLLRALFGTEADEADVARGSEGCAQIANSDDQAAGAGPLFHS
jgi:hypothetical protein